MRLAQLSPFWDRGADRALGFWDARSAREQILLGALVAVGLVALLLVAVVKPLESARARAAADIRTYDMLTMRLKTAGPVTGTVQAGPPAAKVSQAAAAAGLAVQRIEPSGGRLNVVLADAPFDAVARFVAEIERTSSLRVSEARIDRSPTAIGSGLVSASLILTDA